jgi:hypothetical protein
MGTSSKKEEHVISGLLTLIQYPLFSATYNCNDHYKKVSSSAAFADANNKGVVVYIATSYPILILIM